MKDVSKRKGPIRRRAAVTKAIVADLVRPALKRQGITISLAADRLQVDPTYLSRALRGDRGWTEETLRGLATIAGLPIDELLIAARKAPKPHGARLHLESVVPIIHRNATLNIVADPDYVDSALLWWILSQQPFSSVGINCILEQGKRRQFPQRLTSNDYAVAVLNKKLSPPSSLSPDGAMLANGHWGKFARQSVAVCHWADLALYSAYAIIGHAKDLPDGVRSNTPLNRAQAVAMLQQVKDRAAAEKRPPVLLTMSLSTIQRLRTPISDSLLNGFYVYENPFAAQAMDIFASEKADLFVGGALQRLALKKQGSVEIVHSGNDPFLVSIASLFTSRRLLLEQRDLVHTVAALWYEMVRNMHQSESYRNEVALGIMDLFATRSLPLSYDVETLRDILDDAVCGPQDDADASQPRLHYFADRPAALVDPLLKQMLGAAQAATELGLSARGFEDALEANLALDSAIYDATLSRARESDMTLVRPNA